VLYEMLTGEAPFSGQTVSDVVRQHIMAPVPSARSLRSSVPPAVESVIMRALAKERQERFETASDMSAALVAPPPVEAMPDYSRVEESVTRNSAPLAGRQREFAELKARLDALASGRGGMVLIGGEPGVGKTKLAEALLLEARARGYVCTVGHCYEMEGSPPYLPFIEQWEWSLRNVPPGRFRAVLGSGAAEFARIMPQLRQVFPDIGPPLDLPLDQQRHYLFTQFREYFARAASNVPLVALLDDLHWADESTLLLIEHLAPLLPSMRLLLVGTYRDVELDVGRPFAKCLERLTRQRYAERIALRRMPEDDVAALLGQLGAPDPPVGLVRAIFAETEGNPFFVEEVFRHLQEEGRLMDSEGHWLADLRIETLEVPEGVRLVIGRRLERVSEACRDALTAAAVIGPKFGLRLLEEASGLDEDTLLDALEEAERAGLVIAQQAKRETHYSFAHELIRQTLLGALSMPRRLRRHLRTAEAMERVYAGRESQHAAEIAYQLFQSGADEEEKTTRYLLLAGQQALAAGAFDEALAQVDRAFSVAEEPDARRRADLLSLRAGALRGLGRWTEARAAYVDVIDQLLALDSADDLLTLTCEYAQMLPLVAAEHESGLKVVARVLAATPDVPSADRARLLALEGAIRLFSGRFAGGHASSDAAVQMARVVGDPETLGIVLSDRASHLLARGHVTESLEGAREAHALLRENPRRWVAVYAAARLGVTLRYGGQSADEKLRLSNELLTEARRIGHRHASFLAASAHFYARLQIEGSVKALEESARELAREAGDLGTWAEAAALFGHAAAHERGDDRACTIALEAARRFSEPISADQIWAAALGMTAAVDHGRAHQILNEFSHRIPVAGAPAWLGTRVALPQLIRGLVTIGEAGQAAALYPFCTESIALGLVGEDSLLEEAAGRAASAGRDWESAERHFTTALQQAHTIPSVWAQPDVRLAWAEMLIARGQDEDRARARGLLEEAVTMYARAGRTRGERTCRTMLESLA
jgi:hypothetical protein